MDLLKGKTLLSSSGDRKSLEDVLSGKSVVCLYFSAHWCPPCRAFTPILKDFYEV